MRSSETTSSAILSIRSLGKAYQVPGSLRRHVTWAARDVSFDVNRGETLAIVGESGSGKSTVGRMVAGLVEPSEGQAALDGVEIHAKSLGTRQWVWRRLQMIFQDPYSSLNPRMTVAQVLTEPLRNFRIATGVEARARAAKVLDACGLSARSLDLYPSEFSGGQRQRIGIARALVAGPEIIVADEPVSALDVSVQAQIVNLLVDLQKEFRLTYLFIGHDLAVVRHIADRVAVMKLGRIVELAGTETLYGDPKEEYTRQLLASSPIPDPKRARAQLYA